VRLFSRNAFDWTVRLAAIAAGAEPIKAKSFTIDGEAVVQGPDGLSPFEELSRREAARTAIGFSWCPHARARARRRFEDAQITEVWQACGLAAHEQLAPDLSVDGTTSMVR
jgi:hypothetical protein